MNINSDKSSRKKSRKEAPAQAETKKKKDTKSLRPTKKKTTTAPKTKKLPPPPPKTTAISPTEDNSAAVASDITTENKTSSKDAPEQVEKVSATSRLRKAPPENFYLETRRVKIGGISKQKVANKNRKKRNTKPVMSNPKNVKSKNAKLDTLLEPIISDLAKRIIQSLPDEEITKLRSTRKSLSNISRKKQPPKKKI